MNFDKKTLNKLMLISFTVLVLGVIFINTEKLYIPGYIFVVIGSISIIILTRRLNSLPLTEKEILQLETTHKKGKFHWFSNALYFGSAAFFVRLAIDIFNSFRLGTPLSDIFDFRNILISLLIFFGIPIAIGYALWKNDEETYKQYLEKKAEN